MKIDKLKKDILVLENEFKNLGYKLEDLAQFACASDKEFNEEKRTEFYLTKKKYEEKRREISELYNTLRELNVNDEQNNTFVNSFGEATERYITNTTYEKRMKRTSKEIMNYIR